MTVEYRQPVINHVGNGTADPLAVPFLFLESGHLVVTLFEPAGASRQLVRGADYNVTGAGAAEGGSVKPLAPIPVGHEWEIARLTPLTQTTRFADGYYSAPVQELAHDRQMLALQERAGAIDDIARRALMSPRGETGDILPAIDARKLRYFAWDASGRAIALPAVIDLIANAAIGIAPGATDLGSDFGSIIPDHVSVKEALLALESAQAKSSNNWFDLYATPHVLFGATDQGPSIEGGGPKMMVTRNGNLAFIQISVTARDKTAPIDGFVEEDALRIVGLPIVANGIQPQILQLEPGSGLPPDCYAALVGDTIGFYLPPGRQAVSADMVADTYSIRVGGIVAILPEDEE